MTQTVCIDSEVNVGSFPLMPVSMRVNDARRSLTRRVHDLFSRVLCSIEIETNWFQAFQLILFTRRRSEALSIIFEYYLFLFDKILKNSYSF